MHWMETIREQIDVLKPLPVDTALLERMVSLIDLTSLNASDTENEIEILLEKARNSFGHVAAVCVYPKFVRLVHAQFAGTPVKTAAVVNFPEGSSSLESVLIEINQALTDGAEEIDVVFPYHRYLSGERQYAQNFVSSCKAACGDNVTLKVILETGALRDPAIIADASWDVIAAGADFIKTSTGKIAEGATPEAAAAILLVIHHAVPKLKKNIGIKISGGVRTIQQAAQYVALADNIMGRGWAVPATFRIGASRLIDEILDNKFLQV